MDDQPEVHYTDREFDVIKLLLLRNDRRTIAFTLDIGDGTVDNHIKHLYQKTGNHSIESLVVYLLSHGFSVNREMTEVTYNGKVI